MTSNFSQIVAIAGAVAASHTRSVYVHSFVLPQTASRPQQQHQQHPASYRANSSPSAVSDDVSSISTPSRPKAIIFDLDGCLWRPEMYELVWFSKGQGAPFTPDPDANDGTLLSVAGEPVRLIGNVRDVMRELYESPDWEGVAVGISSRTDEPDWARELLRKFEIAEGGDAAAQHPIVLQDVFEQGPVEIAKDGKIKHFQRIANKLGISFGDMLFFDNESGNCKEVARLGVTVAYCPDGVTNQIWEVALEAFPQTGGEVIGIDLFGYDSLEGAQRFY
eukprot:CAMPEP_0178639846 /NCGR_PEP_ID=MMETSP0698-20121128/15691_1 /TAXON_ID=265572 /ORGANISM="Extubocellulus spinifer, Strain CCMP396" /LENGTH=276 /DNA_ID=CAMNT_0020280227 /DNA_START=23 /DNA_END=853 /DNA_ORIENTATION=+